MTASKDISQQSGPDEPQTVEVVIGLTRDVYRSAAAIAADIGQAAGIHATDADALRMLDAATGRPTMTDLATELALSAAAVTALVDRLERAGLARRVRDQRDRRRIRVELTETAQQLGAASLQPLMERITRAVQATPTEELAVVARFLGRLTDESTTPR